MRWHAALPVAATILVTAACLSGGPENVAPAPSRESEGSDVPSTGSASVASSQPTTPLLTVSDLLESPTRWVGQQVVVSGTLVLDAGLQLCTSGEDSYPPSCGRGVSLTGPGAGTLSSYVACLAANEADESAFGIQIAAAVEPGPALAVQETAAQASGECST
jgi:hypothetical protein